MMEEDSTSDLALPGFRFHPTEEELLDFYLKNMLLGKKLHCEIIGFLNIYHHEPCELPGLANIGEREWYFFVPRDKKQGSAGRPNRTTKSGFWKATGSDRKILSSSNPKKMLGLKKTLVFYKGRAPRGCRTDWIMNEYRLPDHTLLFSASNSKGQEDVVLCKIYRKATSFKVLEQRAAIEDAIKASFPHHVHKRGSITPMPFFKRESCEEELLGLEKKIRDDYSEDNSRGRCKSSCTRINFPHGKTNLTELQVPKFSTDWTQDPFWTQLRSPWLEMSFTPLANLLNF